VAGGFAAAARGMIVGRSRKELEGNAMRDGFWGGLGGNILSMHRPASELCCLKDDNAQLLHLAGSLQPHSVRWRMVPAALRSRGASGRCRRLRRRPHHARGARRSGPSAHARPPVTASAGYLRVKSDLRRPGGARRLSGQPLPPVGYPEREEGVDDLHLIASGVPGRSPKADRGRRRPGGQNG